MTSYWQIIHKEIQRKSAINDVNDLSDQKVKSEDSEKIFPPYTFFIKIYKFVWEKK